MPFSYGVARGLFSNESGLGSAPIAAAAAKTKNPVRQALVSSTGTFWDTVVVCLMTGLVLVTTIMKNPAINIDEAVNGGELTTMAFGQIPFFGPLILVVGIISFAYSTIWDGRITVSVRRIFCGKSGTSSISASLCSGASCRSGAYA